MKTQEINFDGFRVSGFLAIFLHLALMAGAIFMMVIFVAMNIIPLVMVGVFIIVCCFVAIAGYTVVEPNEVRVMVFFGKYKGTLSANGFFWVNPFYSKTKLVIRARNLDVEPIKVNDKGGNPIMIGLVLVWKLKDVYKAVFDIDNKGGLTTETRMASYQNFVMVQSDAALRDITGKYAYDNNEEEGEITLRSGGEEINDRLEAELNKRLDIAGIEVVEARINYLAYAPEIAAVMLRRQQAAAIISAREKIVEGAVSMVKMALDKLSSENVVELDDDKKAAMVSNLLVVLCADEQAQPVINTGTLHQ